MSTQRSGVVSRFLIRDLSTIERDRLHFEIAREIYVRAEDAVPAACIVAAGEFLAAWDASEVARKA